MLLVLFCLVLALIPLYILARRPYKYWIERGVKQGNPSFPFGESLYQLLQSKSAAELVELVYDYAPNGRYSGMYQCLSPILVLRDPELIKQITVKDFDHFLDHMQFIPDGIDPLWSGNLFALTGQKWRDMRVLLSPAFTSSKMRFMFNLISESGKQFIDFFLKKDQDVIELEMKDTLRRFANDVIANTAFGVKCDSLKDRDNEFYLRGIEATDFSGLWKNIKFFIIFLFPSFTKILNAMVFSEQVSKFFISVTKSNIETREKQNIIRPDMIHLLMEARKNGLKQEENAEDAKEAGFATVEEANLGEQAVSKQKRELSDLDITAQALIFFFAGFDSVSGLMCFMSYELAVNPDIQEKLIAEVDETAEFCKGNLTYDALTGMKYMDMVVSESLRNWPNAVVVDRVCTKPYTIPAKLPGEKPINLDKGDVLWLPIYAIHRDPEHWSEPEKFDPERFNDENKHDIKPYSYLPFGTGPRNCIGSRFALLETKTLFYYLLSNFEIVPTAKTQIPMKLCKKQFALTAENGCWLGLKRRVK